jgi:hypothetical protein
LFSAGCYSLIRGILPKFTIVVKGICMQGPFIA